MTPKRQQDQLRKFFSLFRPAGSSRMTCLMAMRPMAGSNRQAVEQTAFTNRTDRMIEFAVKHGAMNVYFSPSLFKAARRLKANVSHVPALFVDLDTEFNAVQGKLKKFRPKPSIVIQSGFGAHAYWLLSEPVQVKTNSDVVQIESILKGLAQAIGAPPGTADVTRVLRPPCTTNCPTENKIASGRKQAPVKVAWMTKARYGIEEFKEFMALSTPATQADHLPGSKDEPHEHVDIRTTKMSDLCRFLVKQRIAPGLQPGRSERDFKVIQSLLRYKWSAPEIRRLFADPCFPIGDKFREEGDHYLERSINRARALMGLPEDDEWA